MSDLAERKGNNGFTQLQLPEFGQFSADPHIAFSSNQLQNNGQIRLQHNKFYSTRDVNQQLFSSAVNANIGQTTKPKPLKKDDILQQSFQPKNKEVSIANESMDSDHERRERILDLCPNFEGDTHSD